MSRPSNEFARRNRRASKRAITRKPQLITDWLGAALGAFNVNHVGTNRLEDDIPTAAERAEELSGLDLPDVFVGNGAHVAIAAEIKTAKLGEIRGWVVKDADFENLRRAQADFGARAVFILATQDMRDPLVTFVSLEEALRMRVPVFLGYDSTEFGYVLPAAALASHRWLSMGTPSLLQRRVARPEFLDHYPKVDRLLLLTADDPHALSDWLDSFDVEDYEPPCHPAFADDWWDRSPSARQQRTLARLAKRARVPRPFPRTMAQASFEIAKLQQLIEGAIAA
jgi:hypothetical protein